MKILANENFPLPAVAALRATKHDVLWARTDMPGAIDEEVLTRAQLESRVVVTLDKDFGELAFRRGLPAGCGIVLFRLMFPDPETAAQRIVNVLNSRENWTGTFPVVEEQRIRLRPLFSERRS
jgi:predicted nuclease of predicted toxin-antitoxin system